MQPGFPRFLIFLLLGLWLGSSPAVAEEPTLQEQLDHGRELLKLHRISEALLVFRVACSRHPESLAAHLGYQDCKLARGRGEDLARQYASRLEEDPTDPTRRYLAARVRPRVQDRILDLEALVREHPEQYGALLDLGRAQRRVGRHTDALASFAQARQLRATDPVPLLETGVTHAARGRADLAEKAYLEALELDPGSAAAYQLLGANLEHSRDPNLRAQGERYLYRALELDPMDFAPRAILARLLAEQRRHAEAERLLLEHMQAHPRDPRSYAMLAELASVKGMTELAESHLLRAREVCPDSPELLTNLAAIYIRPPPDPSEELPPLEPGSQRHASTGSAWVRLDRSYDEAERLLREAVDIHPLYGPAWCNLGRCYMEQGRNREAIEAFGQALECDGVSPAEVWPGLARARAALASELWRRADELEGAGTEPSVVASLRQQVQLELEQARRAYLQALQLQPGHGTLRYEFAKVCFSLGLLEECIQQLEVCLMDQPVERPPSDLVERLRNTPVTEVPPAEDVHYLRALACMGLNRLEEAEKWAGLVLATRPRHQAALELLRQIRRRQQAGEGR